MTKKVTLTFAVMYEGGTWQQEDYVIPETDWDDIQDDEDLTDPERGLAYEHWLLGSTVGATKIPGFISCQYWGYNIEEDEDE
jgi:hypothetical protein